jgi:hypothetical protein
MMIKKFSRMAVVAATVVAGFASCSDNDGVGASIVPGTQEAINKACADWRTARANWENTEAFLFGAADVYSIDPHTDTWPVASTDLANVLRDNDKMSNLSTFLKTAKSDILGYHGIEYVLFRDGSPRNINQVTENEYRYICAVAEDLYNATATLEATWDANESNAERKKVAQEYVSTHYALDDDGNVTEEGLVYENFGKAFKNPGAGKRWETNLDATLEIISGCVDIIGEVGNSKIGLPYTGEDVTYVESPYAWNSITDFYDNIISCKNALYGSVGATAPNDKSLIYFCLNSNNNTLKTQAQTVQTKLDNALAKIKDMKYPFVKYYSDSSCKTAMDALTELSTALDALSETLKGYSGNTEVQNACKEINANYVDNVVVATYRTLANNAYTLWQSIKNIKTN